MDDHVGQASQRDAHLQRAASHWDGPRAAGRVRWWRNSDIRRHVNRIVCGEPCAGKWEGFNREVAALAPVGGFRRGISVACGSGAKELTLLRLGVVQHFDLYEISGKRAQAGMDLARRSGLEDRVTFHVADAFAVDLADDYDLVHWNNALHHMMDTPAAVRWSWDRLQMGGAFVMDDFVGASRFQWPDCELDMIEWMRRGLPGRMLIDPKRPEATLPLRPVRPDESRFFMADPTEAADSERILPAIGKFFPNAKVTPTGGVLYQTGLTRLLGHFSNDPEDSEILERVLRMDEHLACGGATHYAVALATKQDLGPGQLAVELPRKRPIPDPEGTGRRVRVRRAARRATRRLRSLSASREH